MKRSLRTVLIILTIVLRADVTWGDDVCPGDVDGNGTVTADDEDDLVELLFNDAVFDLPAPGAGDADGNGAVSSADLVAVAQLQGSICADVTPTPSLRPSPTATIQNTRSATPTPTVTPPISPTYSVLLRWTTPPEPDVSGYRIYSGRASHTYDRVFDVGLPADDTVRGVVYYSWNVSLEGRIFVAVTAYNSAALESDYSNEKVLDFTAIIPPVADAAPEDTAVIGTTIAIGSAPRPGTSYFWQQTGGPPAMLAGRTSSRAELSGTIPGIYTFTVTAYDVQGIATRAWVHVTFRTP